MGTRGNTTAGRDSLIGLDAGHRPRRLMRDGLVSLARIAGLILLTLFVVGIFARQVRLLDRHLIFFPERELISTPADVGLEYEDVFFTASDGARLHGWFVPGESETTLLWFHGNAGNISHRVDNLSMLHEKLGVNILIFDYRGYGRSEGKASETGMYLDAEAVREYLSSRDDVDLDGGLVLFGRSLGSAVAVEMAARYKVRAVILESPFTSIRAMARRSYPFLPVGILIRLVEARYDALARIGSISSPLMVVHGSNDEIAPIKFGRELFEAARAPKRFYTIEGAGHNDTYWVGGDAYFEALKDFIEDPKGYDSK